MFRSLYSKLAAVLTLLFVMLGLAFVGVVTFSVEMYKREVNQKLNRFLAANIVKEKFLLRDSQVNQEALEDIFHMMMVINPAIEIYLLDPAGNILAFSAPKEKIKLDRVDMIPINRWVAGAAKIPTLGDDPRNPREKKVFTVARIPEEGRLEGYLYVILGGELYDSVVQQVQGSYVLQLTLWMGAACLVFALIAGLVLFGLLTGRLKRLANSVATFRKEKNVDSTHSHLDEQGRFTDEIDRLAFSFGQLEQRINQQIEALKQSDALRRELVANVSHDLRTPLATLQGYIETLLIKKDVLSDEEQRRYLETAVGHCQRLNKLVDELFELAKLDSGAEKPRFEPFNLNELIQDIVQKFELAAGEKGILIKANLGGDLPFVTADIGMIERVLENLIENAVHYTPNDGSINIVVAPGTHAISVQVRDTGCGIPKEELSHVFDRFYQLDKSREDNRGHSGLGLAITKRILELHDISIKASSILDAGTTFAFKLPIHNPA
jgi:two-component system, OmpR family, sensor kinase